MVRNSIQYKYLCRRVQKLSYCYLPPVRIDGNYTKKEQDDIRAYSLLAHAEIESYIETVSRDKVQKALNKWLADKKYNSKILLSLTCFIDQSERIRSATTLEDKMKLIAGNYYVMVKNNHGIKEDNIHNLILPIGIDESTLDNTLMSTLTSFGKTRGEYAHTSASVQTMPDPLTIQSTVNLIITSIANLDLQIKSLK